MHCYPHSMDKFVEVCLLFPYVWLGDSSKAKSRDHLYFPRICPGFKVRTRKICILGVWLKKGGYLNKGKANLKKG